MCVCQTYDFSGHVIRRKDLIQGACMKGAEQTDG